MAFSLESYRFRGLQAEGRGQTLAEAADDLADFWSSRPSLVPHAWGVLTLQITVGSTQATIQVTDPNVLDQLEVGNTQPLIDMLAQDMKLDRRDAELLLSESSEVVATVDRIRPPSQPNAWSPDTGTEPDQVLPQAALAWVRDVGKDLDRQVRRDKGRARTKRGKSLLRMVVQSGQNQGLTDGQISRRTGLPRSTVRDARLRLDRDKRVISEFKTRRPGQRLSDEQKGLIMERLKDTDGNAAAAARQLGISPRTVRDLKARTAQAETARVTPIAKTRAYTDKDRARLISMVSSGLNATEAGRKLGIPGRTARGWVRREKLRREDE